MPSLQLGARCQCGIHLALIRRSGTRDQRIGRWVCFCFRSRRGGTRLSWYGLRGRNALGRGGRLSLGRFG
ncbi:MAG: hypothetical protein WBM40_13330, partial [Thiohalocapsa sp.]